VYGISFTLLLTGSTAMEVDAESVHAGKVFGPPPSVEFLYHSYIQKDVEDTRTNSRASSPSNQANQTNQHRANAQSDSYIKLIRANISPLYWSHFLSCKDSNSLLMLRPETASTPPPIHLCYDPARYARPACGSPETDGNPNSSTPRGFATCYLDHNILHQPAPKRDQLSALSEGSNASDRDSPMEEDKASDTDRTPLASEGTHETPCDSDFSYATTPYGSDSESVSNEEDNQMKTTKDSRGVYAQSESEPGSQIEESEESPCPSISLSSSHTSSRTNSRPNSPSNQANPLSQDDIRRLMHEGHVVPADQQGQLVSVWKCK